MKTKIRWSVYIVCFVFIMGNHFEEQITSVMQPLSELFIRHSLRNEHIIVSFSTTPYRIEKMQSTVKSLFEQNAKIDKIYLSVPYKFKRDNLEYKIPQWLQDEKRITILRTEDYGPATKILGVLEQVKLDPNTIIITVDDDIYYPHNLVLQLAYKAKQNPNYAIGLTGSNPEYDEEGKISKHSAEGFYNNYTPDASVSFLQGFSGIAYRRKFFDESIFEIKNAPKECVNSDDLYLSFYLSKRAVKRTILNNNFLSARKIKSKLPIGTAPDALHNLIPAPVDKHRICVAYMKEKNPDVEF